MSAGWVAGSVRARALARRRLGPVRAQRLAASGSLDSALAQLAGTAYGRNVHQGLDIAAAQYEIARTVLWDLRVLAGWLPHDGVAMLRTLAAWFELANVDEMLAVRGGPAFDLGALATDWPQIRAAGAAGLRTALAASAWRDPGGDIAHAVRLGMRARYAVRVAELGNPARTWAAGAAALLVAGERLVAGRAVDPAVFGHVPRLVGPSAAQAGSLAELTAGLLPRARWVLDGIRAPGDLWRAESTWRARVEQDGLRLLHGSNPDLTVVLGAVAVMACDALRVRAALEAAARGSDPRHMEAYDELA